MRATILSPAGATFTTASAEQKPPQRTNKGVRRLLARVKADKGAVRIAVILVPIVPGRELNTSVAIRPLSKW